MSNDYEQLRSKTEALERYDPKFAAMIEGLAEDPAHYSGFIATVTFAGINPHKIGNLPEVDRAMLGRLVNWASLQIAVAVLKRRIQLAPVVDVSGVEIVGRCEACGKPIESDDDYAFTEMGVPSHIACVTTGPLYNTQGDSI